MTTILAGNWWKFDRYELREGMIGPARGAKLSRYDPWEDQNPGAPLQQDRVPAYRSLLGIVSRIKFLEGAPARTRDRHLTARCEQEVLDWCGRYGLLGILLHDAVLITLAPREKKISASERREIQKLWRKSGRTDSPPRTKTIQKSYTRTTYGWTERGQPIHRKYDLRTPAVVTQNYFGDTLHEQQLFMLHRYFRLSVGSDLPEAWQTFDCPTPLSERFWMLYSESLDDFLERAELLRRAIASMNVRTFPEPTSVETANLRGGLYYLRGLLAPVGFGYTIDPKSGLRPRLLGGSLLSILAAMALQDAPKGRVLQCDVCGSIFIAGKRTQTRYCSKRCRATAQKRAVRQREKRSRRGKTR